MALAADGVRLIDRGVIDSPSGGGTPMKSTRFDDVTRALARPLSRRAALELLLGSLFGVGVAQRGERIASSSCPVGNPCGSFEGEPCAMTEAFDGDCVCIRSSDETGTHCTAPVCASDTDCSAPGSFCTKNECADGLLRCSSGCQARDGARQCPDGTVLCGASCVDVTSDRLHCGACNHGCFDTPGPGYASMGDCVEGRCQPRCLDTADHCSDLCTDFSADPDHCGACDTQCGPDALCCGGRCITAGSAERYCDACGLTDGWPQNCLAFETCDGGRCVAESCPDGAPLCGDQCPDFMHSRWNCGACGAICQEGDCGYGACMPSGWFAHAVVAVDCFAELSPRTELPHFPDPRRYVDLYAPTWCDAAQGVLVEAIDSSGSVVASCTTADGLCMLRGPQSASPLKIRHSNPSEDIVPGNDAELATIDTGRNDSQPPTIVIDRYAPTAAASPAATERTEPTGDLAYAIRIGTHWNVWSYSFETRQNHRLTRLADSDQWAPAYSHDGSRLAYLSDEVDGVNQIWIMNPDGSEKRQISRWRGPESILYVAWSPDDTQFIVSLSGDAGRLVTMPVDGGDFTDFIPPASSFASTGGIDSLAYTIQDPSLGTLLCLTSFRDPTCHGYVDGDTPNLSPDGAYVVVQTGEFGKRAIATYAIGVPGPALPGVPHLADDSNPVWLTRDHTAIAFVSAGPKGDTVQLYWIGDDRTTRIEIAPHDQVWYLAKRFVPETDGEPRTAVHANTGGDASGRALDSGFSGFPARGLGRSADFR